MQFIFKHTWKLSEKTGPSVCSGSQPWMENTVFTLQFVESTNVKPGNKED